MFLSPQWFWLSLDVFVVFVLALDVLDIQNSYIIDRDKLCKVIEILCEMTLRLVPSFKMAIIFAVTLNFTENSG